MTNPRLSAPRATARAAIGSPARPAQPLLPAFSLVELLVVIAIIAIVTAIIVPSLAGVRTAGRITSTRTLMGNINTAAAAFQTDERRLPGYFSAAQMGLAENAKNGFSAMENVMLDLAGGVQRAGTGPGSVTAGWLRVGPGKALADQVWIDPNQIGSSSAGGKSYFIPPAKNFVIQTKDPLQKVAKSSPATEDLYKLPDLVDAFGSPLLAWVENEAAGQTVTGPDDFAQVDSSVAGKPPAKFYWNSNAAFLQAESLGKLGKNQKTDSHLFAGGTYPSATELSPQGKSEVLAGILGNMGYPNLQTSGANFVPSAARGRFILHSAGPDGIYFSKYDTKGKGFGGSQIKYGYYFSPDGDPTSVDKRYMDDTRTKSQPVDYIVKFDDVLHVGGS